MKLMWMACAAVMFVVPIAAAEDGIAGKWIGEAQGRGGATNPVAVELVVKGSTATGTVAIGEDPVKAIADGKVQGTTVTFTTPTAINGREIPMTWRGTLKDGELAFIRTVGGGAPLAPLSLRRSR